MLSNKSNTLLHLGFDPARADEVHQQEPSFREVIVEVTIKIGDGGRANI